MDLKYPEHEKLAKVKDRSQAIGEFMDWLNSEGIVLAYYPVVTYDRYGDPTEPYQLDELVGYHDKSLQQLLAEFFGIDLNKLEQEKQAMLEELRSQ